MARAYNKLPTHGEKAEKRSTDRKLLLVYQKEYKNAAKMAASDDAPISVAPNAPSVPRRIA
jgi:hypothetical protein